MTLSSVTAALLSIAENSKAGTLVKSVQEYCDGLRLFTAELNGAVRRDLPRREHDSCHVTEHLKGGEVQRQVHIFHLSAFHPACLAFPRFYLRDFLLKF